MELTRRTFVGATAAAPLAAAPEDSYRHHFRDDHDAGLPAWGPYTNRYIGISHVADARRGMRFDLSIFPGYYRRKVTIPHSRWESDFHPWEAAADLTYYSFRHQLEWKDRVYCDVSYSRIDNQSRLVRCECVNHTERHQNLVVNYIAYLNYPGPRQEVVLPEGAQWLGALGYRDLTFATPRPQDNLNVDGMLRGEALGQDFTGGSGVGKNFGGERGDAIDYDFDLPAAIGEAVLIVRYRVARRATARISMRPLVTNVVALEGEGEFRTAAVPCGALQAGHHEFRLVSESTAAVDLDGFVIAPADGASRVAFRPQNQDVHPETIEPGARPGSVLLKYKGLDHWYGIAWNHEPSQVRQFFCAELDNVFRDRVQDHVSLVLRGPGDGHFTNVFLRPILIPPKASATVHGMVCSGSRAEVERMVATFPKERDACEQIYGAARQRRVEMKGSAVGRRYEFGAQRLAICALTNVVFPIYIKRHFITHTSPGRWWNSLYSWDAGFVGLGLMEADLDRSITVLNAYLTRPGDQHAAFIHHGTPLPVQIYQFHEIWNRTQSRQMLEYYYPRLRQYHMFLAGRLGSSTTRRLKSQLLQTWDYFYNTGWDDYPPQMYMHQKKLEKSLAPPVTTAHAIRTSKLLAMMAQELGEERDLAVYHEDVGIWTEALQRNSWDEESGYYGYVQHDGDGRPSGILRHEGGQNFNMGMCGAYPMFAGICTLAQEKRILGHMMSEQHLWTRIGMTTVDRSAAYYRPDGYWNGAVWFPHQWFVWKSLLDLGYADEAHRIARAALDLWQQEADDTYGCFEHFMVDSGRGAGWHHFTSLSAPVLSWYAAYYRPGTLTTGFDAWVESRTFDGRKLETTLRLTGENGRDAVVLCVMPEGRRYRATVDGTAAKMRVLASGTIEIRVPHGGLRRVVVS